MVVPNTERAAAVAARPMKAAARPMKAVAACNDREAAALKWSDREVQALRRNIWVATPVKGRAK